MNEYNDIEETLSFLAASVLEEKLQDHMSGHSDIPTKDLLEIYKIASQQRPTSDFLIMIIASQYKFLRETYLTLKEGETSEDHQRIISQFLRDFYKASREELVLRAKSLKDGQKMKHIKE